MSRNVRPTLDYLAQIGAPAIIIEVFPRNESDETWFSKIHCRRIPSNGETAGHPWLILLAWKNTIFCYYCQVFGSGYPLSQHSIPLHSAGTTLVPGQEYGWLSDQGWMTFWSGRCLAGEEVLMRVVILWFIGFNGAVHWSLCWKGLGVTLTDLAFMTSPISIITPCIPSNFYTPLSGTLQKCFKLGPALANAGNAWPPYLHRA